MISKKAISIIMVLSIATTIFSLSYAYYYYGLYQEAFGAAPEPDSVEDVEGNNVRQEVESSQKFSRDKLSPAIILSKYVTALKAGDNKLMNSLLSRNYIEERTAEGKGVPEFPPQKISDVLIMINDYEDNNEREANYILQFIIDEESNPAYYYAGEHYYFVKLVYEDDKWKIDSKATSP